MLGPRRQWFKIRETLGQLRPVFAGKRSFCSTLSMFTLLLYIETSLGQDGGDMNQMTLSSS